MKILNIIIVILLFFAFDMRKQLNIPAHPAPPGLPPWPTHLDQAAQAPRRMLSSRSKPHPNPRHLDQRTPFAQPRPTSKPPALSSSGSCRL